MLRAPRLLTIVCLAGCLVPAEPSQPGTCEIQPWYLDEDGDGYGSPFAATASCVAPEGYVATSSDCHDDDPERFPEAVWYADADQDGHGDASVSVVQCSPPPGYVSSADDCDDLDSSRYPGGFWYHDSDGDTFGDPDMPVDSCAELPDASALSTDCDDADAGVHPDAVERCDGLDNDCNTLVDEEDPGIFPDDLVSTYEDLDGDGWGTFADGFACPDSAVAVLVDGDCDDEDADVHPGLTERYGDERDVNCDGLAGINGTDVAALRISGSAEQSVMGWDIAGADLDSDGTFDDLVVSHRSYATEAGAVGAVSLYLDPASRPLGAHRAAAMWTGSGDGDLAGNVVEAFDGLNLDDSGLPAIFVAAPGAGASDEGVAYLLPAGAPSGLLEEQAHAVLLGPAAGAGFPGKSTYANEYLWVGAPGIDQPTANSGGVLLYGEDDLRGGGEVDSVNSILSTGGIQLGVEVTAIGDTDGDGVDEVAVSATRTGGQDGRVYAVAENQVAGAMSVADLDRGWTNTTNNVFFGLRVAGMGDVDGDGLDDVAISSHLADIGGANRGMAVVMLGNSDPDAARFPNRTTSAYQSFYGTSNNDNLGYRLENGGDFDGDGTNDLFVSVRASDLRSNNGGLVVGLSGARGPGTWSVQAEGGSDWVFAGDTSGGLFAESLCAAGDQNGDGFDDMWMADPELFEGRGGVVLFMGAPL